MKTVQSPSVETAETALLGGFKADQLDEKISVLESIVQCWGVT
jgi:hypothetical protein